MMIISDEFIKSWRETPEGRYPVGLLGGSLLGMFIACILDTVTPTPTVIWALIWAFIPVALMIAPWLLALMSRTYGLNHTNREAVERYYSLSKEHKSIFPDNTLSILKANDSQTAHYFLSSCEALDRTESLYRENSYIESREVMKAVRDDVLMRERTHKELK